MDTRLKKAFTPLCALHGVILLAACGVTDIAARDCPAVNILSTADQWQAEGKSDHKVQLTSAQLVCKKGEDDKLLAEVTIGGIQNRTGGDFPVFLAAVDAKGVVLARTQYRLKLAGEVFSVTLPDFEYDHIAPGNRQRQLVVGFVLSRKQLAANRAVLRKSLGLNN